MWQPIDTAPKDGTVIWAFTPHERAGNSLIGGYQYPCAWGEGTWFDTMYFRNASPTHWQPLPKPPTGE
jgi:hypothetical protein